MSTTTSVLASDIKPFAHRDSRVNNRGNRVYWACTWLQSQGPNGRYEIEKLSPTMWIATHHQVIHQGEDSIVRRISGAAAKTKHEAIDQCERDSHHLAENVMYTVLNGKPLRMLSSQGAA